MARVLLKK